jgi:hypothetical protein
MTRWQQGQQLSLKRRCCRDRTSDVELGGIEEWAEPVLIRDRNHAVQGQRRLPPSHPEADAAGDELAGL